MIQPKRQSAAIMALLVFFFSVFPAKRSEALIPLVGLTVAAIGPGGTLVTADILAAGVSSLIGGSIIALAITPSTADAPMRVPLASDQATIDQAMPPPVAQASTTPNVRYSQGATCSGHWGEGSNAAAACVAGSCSEAVSWYGEPAVSVFSLSYSGSVCSAVIVTTRNSDGYELNRQIQPNRTISANTSCPTGYTASGPVCNLTAVPRAAVPDQKYDVPKPVSAAAGYVAPSTSQEIDSIPKYASFSGGKVYATGKDALGRPTQIEYALNADGSKTYITHYTQMEDATQTTVKTQSVTVDRATGQVTGASTATALGSIASPTAINTAGTVTTGAAVTSGAGSSSSPIVFPTDYARAGEAASAANTVKTSVDQLKDKVTNSETVDDPTVPDWADNWGSTFNPLKAWSMPGHASSCPTGGFEWNGVSYTMNSHCQLILDHWSGLQTAAVVVWTISAIWILLGA